MSINRKIIGTTYTWILKPILFKFDPEKIHNLFLKIGIKIETSPTLEKITENFFKYKNTTLKQTLKGMNFANPIGLSAGFDKDAQLIRVIEKIGFGFTEVGSVTAQPYPGNEGKRLYRLPKSKAIVVNYGLKNNGIDQLIKQIKRTNYPKNFPIGISIAKTNCKLTTNTKNGIEDYITTIKKLLKENTGTYFTINISCPNTFGGTPFTTPEKLEKLLTEISKLNIKKPIFIKLPIDKPWKDLDELIKIIIKHKIDGVVISNLTKKTTNIKDKIPKGIKGGISGLPLQKKSNSLITKTYKKYGKTLTIIGVGGIFNATDAYEKIKCGASLVQLITGLIFNGPQLIGEINQQLAEMLKQDGFKNIKQAIGINNKTI